MPKVLTFKAKVPPPTAEELKLQAWELAKDSSNIIFKVTHFNDRLKERSIGMRQVLETLRHGEVISGPTKDDHGDWRIKLCRKVAGTRIQVVVAVKARRLTVITVM